MIGGEQHLKATATSLGGDAYVPELPESFFRTVIETANEGIWLIDCEGRTTFANARMARMLGRTPEEMTGMHPREVLVEDDLPRGVEVIRKTLGGEPQEFEVRFRRSDGSIIPVLAGSAPIREPRGAVVGAVATFSDLTAHKKTEDDLRASQALLAQQLSELNALYASAPIGLGFFSRDYRYLRINDELAAINGVPAADHIGRTIRDVLSDSAPPVEPVIDQVFASGEAVRLETSGETPQQPGVLRHWLTGFYPVKDSAGAVQAVGAWVVEISERKAAEQREVLLAREVDHRAKNLLAVVQSVVQLTRASDPVELKEAILGRIQALARAHSLLANSRWDGAQLGDLVREELAPYLDGAGARVTAEGPLILLRPAAAQSVAMVLHELATNAAKYGALSRQAGRLNIAWRRDGEWLELAWIEQGGPSVEPPETSGFGSRIMRATIERQLHGKLDQQWPKDGLRCTIRISAAEAVRAPIA